MALDPHMEDYLRLSLHFAKHIDASNPFEVARAANAFAVQYQNKRDALEQSDADRAFGLVVKATELIDYTLPFSLEENAQRTLNEAQAYLQEALDLDARCHDAYRMLNAARCATSNDYQQFLESEKGRIRESCLEAQKHVDSPDLEMTEVARSLAMRPYLRWLAADASVSLISGRYRLCRDLCQEILGLEKDDPANSSFTLALALAKLEDKPALTKLAAKAPKDYGGAWFGLAQASLAFKLGQRQEAEHYIKNLIEHYPQANLTLTLQQELPDGIYARILVEPGSADELILATSEATVLLQEGCDAFGRGTLGSWIATLPCVQGDYAL